MHGGTDESQRPKGLGKEAHPGGETHPNHMSMVSSVSDVHSAKTFFSRSIPVFGEKQEPV
jgi:hypothetical protein